MPGPVSDFPRRVSPWGRGGSNSRIPGGPAEFPAVRYVHLFDMSGGVGARVPVYVDPAKPTNRFVSWAEISGGDAAAGAPTSVPHVITPLFPQLRQVRKTGEFEAVVSFGLGLRSRHGFRVFRLTSPTRVVIDLAH